MKRITDLILALFSLIILSPLLIPVVIILKFSGEGFIFYKQERVGKNEAVFNLLKFATMFKNSPNMKGGNITSKEDPRVLPLGKILRKYKINELPQIINVLKGEMSIIGRRPTVKEHFNFYNSNTKKVISKLKPGLSGVSSIVFRNEEKYFIGKTPEENKKIYKDKIAPFKGQLEVWYFNNQSIFKDIQLMIVTIILIIKPSSNIHNLFLKNLPKHSIYNPD